LSLDELIADTARHFRSAKLHYGHGTDNPRDEAAYLVLRGLKLPFNADLRRTVTSGEQQKIRALARHRIEKRIPVAYLLREAWLDGQPFYVDRRVIVPRSHIAGLLRERMRPWLQRPVRRVLDLCTGSGCLAVLAARAFPRARVDAADLSAPALKVAQINIERHRLKGRVRLIQSDLFGALGGERYDLILTNPPYVTPASMRWLAPEYLHEPSMALAGGPGGLALVRKLVQDARPHLNAGAVLACEVGDGRKRVERAYPRAGLVWPQDEVFILQA
jgi:ribosomal protein L3 glutamine methyltransferase